MENHFFLTEIFPGKPLKVIRKNIFRSIILSLKKLQLWSFSNYVLLAILKKT